MPDKTIQDVSWDFYAKLIILAYAILQVIHWPILPLFMDIHYHLHTAWGFIQAGGYSGWDFWEFAPYGRPHIYPPIFHIILAFLLKIGMDKIILAKCLEVILPVLFLVVVWNFTKKHYGSKISFFMLIMLGSSFSFYLSLINHLPATLALILGILAISQLLKKNILRSILLLALVFYTHTGIAWFFALSLIFFGFFEKEYRRFSLYAVFLAVILSLPITIKQLISLRFIKGTDLNEKYICEFKTIDYLLVLAGIAFSWKSKGIKRLFIGLFLGSFIFLLHPYRFFSAEGYLPLIFLAAIALEKIHEQLQNKGGFIRYLPIAIISFLLFISPTILTAITDQGKISARFYNFDSALVGMAFPDRNPRVASSTLWFAGEYLPVVNLIKQNSEANDIIYSHFSNVSVSLADLSGRATSNGLFPDVKPLREFDPISVAKIFIVVKYGNLPWLESIVRKYNLAKVAETQLFIVYKNPIARAQFTRKTASLPFWGIILLFLLLVFTYYFSAIPNNRRRFSLT
jgi:hypothetical protein